MLDNKTCLTFHGVSEYLERQFNAQKEKHIVQSILETGRHRNVKKRKQKSRVTIPKKKYNRKYISEAMEVITKNSKPSPYTNKSLTTRDLAEKGFSHAEVIETANDIENVIEERIKNQFTDKDAIIMNKGVQYKSALQSLHSYLHSFNL